MKKLFKTIKSILGIKDRCQHVNYKVLSQLGPTTGRGKIWQACQCKECNGYFTQELMSGFRKDLKGPGFGFINI